MMSAQIPNSGDEPVGFQVPDKKNLDNREKRNRLG